MIAKLKGFIDQILNDSLIIDVNGVGYHVFCSSATLAKVEKSKPATLYIQTHVREDHIYLYGFSTEEEKRWFELLTIVQGVGNKMALSLLSALSPTQLYQAILVGDKTSLIQVSGVGPKLAQRIVGELKDKVGKESVGEDISELKSYTDTAFQMPAHQEALLALINLGYQRSSVLDVLGKAVQKVGKEATTQDLIKEALRVFSQY